MKQLFKAQKQENNPYMYDIINSYGRKVAEAEEEVDDYNNTMSWGLVLYGTTYKNILEYSCRTYTLGEVLAELDKYFQEILQKQIEAYKSYLELSESLLSLPKKYQRTRKTISEEVVKCFEVVQELGIEIRLLTKGHTNPPVLICTDEQGAYRLQTNRSSTGAYHYMKGATQAVRVPELSIIHELGETLFYIKPINQQMYTDYNKADSN